ncbi:MAG: hypothetical protein V4671_06815, partial [Armatimonadota bacterium]
KERRRQEHQDQEDGAFTGGRPDTDDTIAAFVASQTGTVYAGYEIVSEETPRTLGHELFKTYQKGDIETLFVPRRPNPRKHEDGRKAIPEQCLLTDLIDAARGAAGNTHSARRKPSKKRRAVHQ